MRSSSISSVDVLNQAGIETLRVLEPLQCQLCRTPRGLPHGLVPFEMASPARWASLVGRPSRCHGCVSSSVFLVVSVTPLAAS